MTFHSGAVAPGVDTKSLLSNESKLSMEGTCNHCVFPLTEAKSIKNKTQGLTSLIYAAHHRKVKCVRQLLQSKAVDVNTEANNGHTALTAACSTGKVDCVKELIKAGACVNKENKQK